MKTGSRWAEFGMLAVVAALAPGAVLATELDGTAPILCAMTGVTECDRVGGCEPVDPSVAGLPPFVRVNAPQKMLEATDGSGRKSPIQSFEVLKEKERLLLQGGENGRLWSVVIGQKTGALTAAITDQDGGFMVSGSCTLP